jgi:hypothetical protein
VAPFACRGRHWPMNTALSPSCDEIKFKISYDCTSLFSDKTGPGALARPPSSVHRRNEFRRPNALSVAALGAKRKTHPVNLTRGGDMYPCNVDRFGCDPPRLGAQICKSWMTDPFCRTSLPNIHHVHTTYIHSTTYYRMSLFHFPPKSIVSIRRMPRI